MLNAKIMGKDQTKKRKMMLKQLKEEVMVGVAEKNTDGVPLVGGGIVTPLFPPTCN